MQPYVFISYSHNDSLIDSLEQIFNHVGINYWFDSFIKPASNWKTVISDRISQCKLFFIVITSTSMLSKYVIEELSIAYKNGKKIFPLFIDDPVIPDSVPDDLAALIERIQYLRIKKCDLVALTVEVQRSIINSINPKEHHSYKLIFSQILFFFHQLHYHNRRLRIFQFNSFFPTLFHYILSTRRLKSA